jgi:hypothetical protein
MQGETGEYQGEVCMTLTTRRLASSVLIGSVLASLALVVLTGCGQDIPCARLARGLAACTGHGTEPLHTVSVAIDWVDFVKFNGIMYMANIDSRTSTQLAAADLGPQFATVKFTVEGNVSDTNYHPKDGDAAFLEPGTPIYTVKGYAPTFLLAAYRNNQIIRYVVDRNPSAAAGAALLDIGGKVTRIGINNETDGTTELGAITDPHKIQSLVALVLAAPVKQDSTQSPSGTRYFLAFHLRDGFTVTRAYWPESGELSRGITLPTAFRTAIEQAISAHN